MTIDRKKRPRRIAADEAHAWARNLRLGNPNAKLVLSMLTLYVDGEGCCFVAIPTLADDTELSSQTVRNRLAWLEQVGAIARSPQWIDEFGRRNGDGKGKRTSDLVRLMIEVETEVIEAAAESSGSVSREVSPMPQTGLNSEAETVSPTLALRQPYDSAEGLISEPEPESSPQPPSGGSVSAEGWENFQKDWQEPILRQSIAQDEWLRLNAEQRALARQAARGYVIWRKEHKKPPNVISAHLFLREKDAWRGFAARAPDAPRAAYDGFPVESPQGKALIALHAVARSSPMESRGRIRYSAEITPQLLAFAGAPPKSDWLWIEERNQIGAWSRFVALHVKSARGDIVTTRGIGEAARKGMYAPWPWPPRKDGALSSTGPPDESAEGDHEAANHEMQ